MSLLSNPFLTLLWFRHFCVWVSKHRLGFFFNENLQALRTPQKLSFNQSEQFLTKTKRAKAKKNYFDEKVLENINSKVKVFNSY